MKEQSNILTFPGCRSLEGPDLRQQLDQDGDDSGEWWAPGRPGTEFYRFACGHGEPEDLGTNYECFSPDKKLILAIRRHTSREDVVAALHRMLEMMQQGGLEEAERKALELDREKIPF